MKKKLAILSGLVAVGVGIWYLFMREEPLQEQEGKDPVGPIQREDHGKNHLREVLHKAKKTVAEPERNIVAEHEGNSLVEREGHVAVPVG